MTIEEINALTVEVVLLTLQQRILDELGETGDPDEYDFIQSDLEAELELYKAELITAEEARLAEVARLQDIHSRLNNINDVDYIHILLRPEIPNAALFIKKNILDNKNVTEAESLLVELETKAAEITLQLQAEEYKDQRKSEYPSIEEVIHVIMDHGIDSVEYNDLQALRESIKLKYPKPS